MHEESLSLLQGTECQSMENILLQLSTLSFQCIHVLVNILVFQKGFTYWKR